MKIADKRILWLMPTIGIIASALLSFTTFRYEIEKEQSRFISQANILFNKIWSSFDELENINENIILLFNTTNIVTEDQFKLFTKPLLTRYPYITTIYYISKIKTADITKTEIQKRNSGYTGFHFRPFPKDFYIQSPSKNYIFPIDYIQPFNVENSIFVGQDILTFKQVQNSVLLSTKMGNTLVFSPGKNNFYVFSSLYFGNEFPNSYEMNIDNVYAILAYKILTKKLLKYIALPDQFKLQIYINKIKTLEDIDPNNTTFSDSVYTLKQSKKLNGQNISLQLQNNIPILDHDFTLPVFVLLIGLLLTFLSWFALRTNIIFNQFLHQQNKIIEAEVDEKTEQLKQKSLKLKMAYEDQVNATNELKSFSYSISHDLRAPLRTIDGFCKILDEDYSEKLDNTGRDYIQRVRRGAQHMGELIDSMLNLALVSHRDIKHESVSLSLIANDIISHLKTSYPERTVDIVIDNNMTVIGDNALLYSVLENLLSNAWKFTKYNNNAKIEFHKQTIDNETTYSIKDNGIGFDMTYANKLFIPFQRLHGKQFKGTGIGLATVERIIKRHRGKISAVAKKDEGATFSFTLGNQSV